MSEIVAQTPRLMLRRLDAADAPFILRLLNEPGWLRFIGDKNIHTLAAAERYLVEGPMAMYTRLGFGLYLVAQQGSAERSDGHAEPLDERSLPEGSVQQGGEQAHEQQGEVGAVGNRSVKLQARRDNTH